MSLKYILLINILILHLLPLNAQEKEEENELIVVDKIVAKVDDYIVLKSELERAYLELLSRGETSGSETKCSVLENLVLGKLMVAKAEIDSVIVEDDIVERNLDMRLSVMVQRIGGEDKIEEYYGKTLEEFKEELREQVKEQLVGERMQQTIIEEVSITPGEVKKFFRGIPKDSLPYFSKEVSVGQIVKKPVVSREEDRRARDILMQIRDQITDKGKDFEEMAKKYSMGPSAPYGGNLGFSTRGQMVPEYEAAALKLKEGDLSMPVKSEFGYHLIQLIERRGNEYNSRHILVTPRFKESDFDKAGEFLDSLKSLVLVDSMSFQLIAKENTEDKATKGSGGFLISAEGSKFVKVSDMDPNLYFTIDTMTVGTISNPLKYTLQDGSEAMRIIYYKESIRPHQANLNEDYQKIQDAALNAKKAKILNDWFKDAKQDVYIEIDPEYQDCSMLSQ